MYNDCLVHYDPNTTEAQLMCSGDVEGNPGPTPNDQKSTEKTIVRKRGFGNQSRGINLSDPVTNYIRNVKSGLL